MTRADARERIVLTAERLIAQRGAEVPLREIAAAAGQGNHSAVQYHFGSREGLVEAVVDYRLAGLEARRMELLADHEAAGGPDDARVLVELLVRPMVELVSGGTATHYARFLEVVRNRPAIADHARLDAAGRSAVRIILARLERVLATVARQVRHARLRAMGTAIFALLGDYERDVEAGAGAVDPGIVEMLVGLVTAPVGVRPG